ncbi:hypothetical protein [Paenibacillus silvisoli]|uniref:hypothetical protein n=1 Tax=Paenibacillus silvisoli TaxID=3110539 RepID=UPI00280583B4|nr:hypothetical protein [Paenibacillus silvisoli]
MTAEFIKTLALLIGIMHNTSTEVDVYTMVECPYAHCYHAVNESGYCLFSETNFKQDTQLYPGDTVYVISLQNEENRVVRVFKAD